MLRRPIYATKPHKYKDMLMPPEEKTDENKSSATQESENAK